MSNQDHREPEPARIKALFDRTMDLPRADREPFVRAEADQDKSLIAEVLELLAHADDGTTQTGPIRETRRVFPDHIGHYKVLGILGEGGFGVVYEAEQTEPVKRRVALKVIKAGMDSKSVVARFEAERQALAVMDHPCVAKIFDGGVTEPEHGGRPYFAMELVRGEPITDYCDKNRLSIEARVELFKKVCEAVQHAHTKGVIHRDLKPSNIMVAHTDDSPTPKVIDFGVAKAINQQLTEATIFTEQGQMIGTPEYMSPEQAEMAGTDIDTRSDIYSLGVILYELLSGRRPFEAADLRKAGLAEIQRIIREDDPPRPSTRVSTALTKDAELASKMASMRRSEPRQLERRLRGELDWVVMKCLSKERDRRYESANGLAAELGRYLEGGVVQARPPSRVYRARKFAKKNKAASVAVISIAGVLIAAAGVSLAFAFEAESARGKAELALTDRDKALANETEQREIAEDARAEAETARIDADQRADELEQVAQFQEEQLGGVNPDGMGLAIRNGLREKLEALAERRGLSDDDAAAMLVDYDSMMAGADFTGLALRTLETEIFEPALDAIEYQFDDRPLIKARMLQTIATTMLDAGLLSLATEPQVEALGIRRTVLGDEHPHTLDSSNDMGRLLQDQGKLSEAEPYLREALEGCRRVLGDDHPDTLISINNMGLLLRDQGKLSEAEPYFREAIEGSCRVLGDDHPATLGSINNMGSLLQDQGKLSEAEPYLREVLEGCRRVLGDDHPNTLTSINNLGALLQDQGKLSEAEPYLREALEGSRRLLGDDHPNTLTSINNLGALLIDQGKLSEAEPYFREALEGSRRLLGDDHPDTLTSINNMGYLLKGQGKLSEAEPYLREALEGSRRLLGDDHPNTLISINNMGYLLRNQGKLSEAEPLLLEAYEGFRDKLGAKHQYTGNTLKLLADVYVKQKHPEKAIALWQAHIDALRARIPAEDPRLASALIQYGTLLVENDNCEEAEPVLRECLSIRKKVLVNTDNGWLIANTQSNLGGCLTKLARFDEAEPQVTESAESLSANAKTPADRKAEAIQRVIDLYTAWHIAEPGVGHDVHAEEWQARLAELSGEALETDGDGG